MYVTCYFLAGGELRTAGGRACSVRKKSSGGGICFVSSANQLSLSLYKWLAPTLPLENFTDQKTFFICSATAKRIWIGPTWQEMRPTVGPECAVATRTILTIYFCTRLTWWITRQHNKAKMTYFHILFKSSVILPADTTHGKQLTESLNKP